MTIEVNPHLIVKLNMNGTFTIFSDADVTKEDAEKLIEVLAEMLSKFGNLR